MNGWVGTGTTSMGRTGRPKGNFTADATGIGASVEGVPSDLRRGRGLPECVTRQPSLGGNLHRKNTQAQFL